MDIKTSKTIYRKDYTPSSYLVESIDLLFRLNPGRTEVEATSVFNANIGHGAERIPLCLNGERLTLKALEMDGRSLLPAQYRVEEKRLVIHDPPQRFTLKVTTEISPEDNTALSGLYKSGSTYCTQCEAEGFRRITYSLDRPDVLAVFTTRIEAGKKLYPVLLSNGNCVEQGDLPEERHYSLWRDPYPKPTYLFALVAGDLACVEDSHISASGRNIPLQIYVEHQNRKKCEHALVSLKKAMAWDEKKFGLEYDLKKYMIVAVDDFNMGAMENKGLNIFNSKYVLASPQTATDLDYLGIEGVIAHEYFHNWTGNRVTCRDWFQLSLKEGLTVYRDQEFSADMNSRAVQRIDDVKLLLNHQFREDNGPMAHPVRPDSYVEINNFYTVTVYNKGAELVRMLEKILGWENFRRGMDLYFERHDGQAVTCDDFVAAMADASGEDLRQFCRWYSQAGTPVLEVAQKWDKKTGIYTLIVTQKCPPSPGQPHKKPFHIPVEIGIIGENEQSGQAPSGRLHSETHLLELHKEVERFTFASWKDKPVLSFLRDFSAPVKIRPFHSREELCFLMVNDDNLFNRWQASYTLVTNSILDVVSMLVRELAPSVDEMIKEAFATCFHDRTDLALNALMLTLPAETSVAQRMETVEPNLLHRAVLFVSEELARHYHQELWDTFNRYNGYSSRYSLAPEEIGRRNLKNRCLSYLMTPTLYDDQAMDVCLRQLRQHDNMSDVVAALSALAHIDTAASTDAFAEFYERWKNDALVMDKWLAMQASSSLENTLDSVKSLMEHPAFSKEKPNKVRALIGTFASQNHARFHNESGAGYRFLTENILAIDCFNPQIAARLMIPFTSYRRYSQKYRVMMEEQIRFIASQRGLSDDVYEIAEKSLV
ncbi:MAG TPA: aminopeptidase N [Desulfopila sp.]|nr:aminopeptidase N [Desulfopila sp.]